MVTMFSTLPDHFLDVLLLRIYTYLLINIILHRKFRSFFQIHKFVSALSDLILGIYEPIDSLILVTLRQMQVLPPQRCVAL